MKSSHGSTSIGFFRAEYPFFIGLATAGIFLALGSGVLENIAHPFALVAILIVLLAAVLWSAISAVHHADCLALKSGEPYGTLILTLSVISIEVMMISAAMLHGENNPTLARDTMFAVVMIALNGLIGFSLLLGGLRHREQNYNLQGAGAYLNTIMALVVLGLVLPNFTTSLSGPRFTIGQEIFLITLTLIIYVIFPPEAMAAIKAARRNQLQRSVNILHGSVLASISLTIPAVLIIGVVTNRSLVLGVEGGNLPLLVLTLAASIVTFGSGKTNILQGCIHLLLFAVFLLLIFSP